MATRTKSTKRVKREIVVPFVGEEMFVVPKRGGFGQPDMEGYVMAVGSNLILDTTLNTTTSSPRPTTSTSTTTPTTTSQPTTTTTQPSGTSPLDETTSAPTTSTTSSTPLFQTGSTGVGSTSSGDSGGVLPSTGTTSTPTPFDPSGAGTLGGGVAVGSGTNAGDTPVGTQTQAGTTTILAPSTMPEVGSNAPSSTPNTVTYGTGTIDLPSGGTGTNTGVVYDQNGNVVSSTTSQVPVTTTSTTTTTDLPPIEIPTFPDLSSMNCTDLNSEIARLSAVIAVSRFPIEVANAYNNQLATAKTLYNTKCPIKKTDEVLVLTPIGGGVRGGGIFGGGGGGIAPEEEVPQEVAPDESGKRIGLFLVLALIGGLYYLTRKRS